MAHRLEFDLYSTASSLEAYMDRSTIDRRLKKAAVKVRRERDGSRHVGSPVVVQRNAFVQELKGRIQGLHSDYVKKVLLDMVGASKIHCNNLDKKSASPTARDYFIERVLYLARAHPNPDVYRLIQDLIECAKSPAAKKRSIPSPKSSKPRSHKRVKKAKVKVQATAPLTPET